MICTYPHSPDLKDWQGLGKEMTAPNHSPHARLVPVPGWILATSSSSWTLRRISCCRPASETPTYRVQEEQTVAWAGRELPAQHGAMGTASLLAAGTFGWK